jgi:hypothetical protein
VLQQQQLTHAPLVAHQYRQVQLVVLIVGVPQQRGRRPSKRHTPAIETTLQKLQRPEGRLQLLWWQLLVGFLRAGQVDPENRTKQAFVRMLTVRAVAQVTHHLSRGEKQATTYVNSSGANHNRIVPVTPRARNLARTAEVIPSRANHLPTDACDQLWTAALAASGLGGGSTARTATAGLPRSRLSRETLSLSVLDPKHVHKQ